jgi:hypothetical protein
MPSILLGHRPFQCQYLFSADWSSSSMDARNSKPETLPNNPTFIAFSTTVQIYLRLGRVMSISNRVFWGKSVTRRTTRSLPSSNAVNSNKSQVAGRGGCGASRRATYLTYLLATFLESLRDRVFRKAREVNQRSVRVTYPVYATYSSSVRASSALGKNGRECRDGSIEEETP